MAKIAPKEGRGAQSNMIGSSENKWVYQPSFLRRHAPDQQAAKDQKHQHCRGLFTGEQENQDLCLFLTSTVCFLFGSLEASLDSPSPRRFSACA